MTEKIPTETEFKYMCHIAVIKQFSTSTQTLLTQKMQPSFDCSASTKYIKIHCDILQGKLQPGKRVKTKTLGEINLVHVLCKFMSQAYF
jgi:hypothetical protein